MYSRKNRNLAYGLVVASSALLLGFLAYWNVTNFLKEKDVLKELMENQLQISYDEVKDSVFIESMIALMDTDDKMKGDTIFLLTTKADGEKREFEMEKEEEDLQIKLISEEHVGPKGSDSLKSSMTIIADYTATESGVNSRVIYQDSSSVSFFAKDSMNSPQSKIDSLLRIVNLSVRNDDKLIDLFQRKLTENNFPSNLQIIDPASVPYDAIRVSMKKKNFGLNAYSFDVLGFRSYVFKKIAASLAFSLFLIGLTFLAFWMLIKNWRGQQSLVDSKNQFINNMTHELKTPISTVSLALEAMETFDVSQEKEKLSEYIDISRSEMNRLSLLVDRVLKMAVYESGDQNYDYEKVDVHSEIAKIIKSMRLQFQQRNANVSLASSVEKPFVFADQVHLANVIYNIVDNSLKYCSKEPKIDISIEEHQQDYVVSFQDNGDGIAKEYIDKIWERFFRIPDNDRHDTKGHGIGLSYVYNVITKLNGKIAVESKLGEGTKFIISLPKYQ